MAKKLTEEQKAARDAERAEAAKARAEKHRSMPAMILCRKNVETLAFEPVLIPDMENQPCSESDGLSDRTQCKAFVTKHNMVGDFWPVRVLKPFSRGEQVKMKITD